MDNKKFLSTLVEQAKQYYGVSFAGLSIEQCDYTTFEKWYNEHHTSKATYEKYLCALLIWHYEEKG